MQKYIGTKIIEAEPMSRGQGGKAEDGYKTQTLCTLVMGVVAIIFIWLINMFI